jgi:hypothetical protein
MKVPVIGAPVAGQPYLDLQNIQTRLAMGTSSDRMVDDTAGRKFIELLCDCGAESDDARGIYDRLYITGAGGGGEALRAFTTVENVAAANAHGAHISLNFAETGTITGQGIAGRNTLHIPNMALSSNVTMAALQAEIWSDGEDSDPGGSTKLSCFRAVNGGDPSGMADVDDDCTLIELSGFTVGDGNMIAVDGTPTTCPNITHSIKCRLPDGSLAYLYLGAAPVTA